MKQTCGTECRCFGWAQSGECDNNPKWMHVHCEAECSSSPPPPALSAADCAQWAREGECESNKDFMLSSCANACSSIARRERCSRAACNGFLVESCNRRYSSRNGTWPIAHLLQPAARATMLPVALVNDRPTAGRLYWVDDLGKETGYGVAMPGGRSTVQTWLGHHWRVRDLETHELWHELHAQVAVAAPCNCGPHLIPRSELIASSGGALGVDGSTPLTLLVELRDAYECFVDFLNRTDGSERRIGVLHPMGSRVVNATHQLLIDGLRSGDVVTVKRAKSGETLMQHIAADVSIPVCDEQKEASLSSDAATKTVASTSTATLTAEAHASKAAALAARRDSKREEALSMAAALAKLKQLGNPENLDEATLREYAEEAAKALGINGGGDKMKPLNLKQNASASALPTRGKRSLLRDELRLR